MCKGSILLILTGGTISMVRDSKTDALKPADVGLLEEYIPELFESGIDVTLFHFDSLIDSSDVSPQDWSKIASVIYSNYDLYDGFVVTHGTDTMSYSASALSFMLVNLQKPIIFTGSQLPVGVLRSDAKENLLTSIEIAAEKDEYGDSIVPEVCIFFGSKLLRANRSTKKASDDFDAFESYNYSPLAIAGVNITYYEHLIHYTESNKPLLLRSKTNQNVIILKLFPGISKETVSSILGTKGLRGVILETYGSGNAPQADWLFEMLKGATDNGIIIVNKTQCHNGRVEMGRYETSLNLLNAGVISGYDITTEALLTKMMCLFGEYDDIEIIKKLLKTDLCGEITIN